MSIFLFNANLSMMNIRDYIFINKAKTVNKIRILDILGFDTNSNITHSPEILKDIKENIVTKEIENEEILEKEEANTNFYSNIENIYDEENIIEDTSTSTFDPIKITSQIKKLWTDIENRRKWIVPVTLISATVVLIIFATSIFVNNRNNQIEIENLYLNLTADSNILVSELEDIINISTDNFYSKYDVSNASANLQLIESTIMEYERNLVNRNDIDNNSILNDNLTNIFTLIDELDNLISYRILLSEILIYEDLLLINEDLDIDLLSNNLSEISATSKLNYDQLPSIPEFNNHISLLKVTLNSAEDLHGRLIASLRNNEKEVANALVTAINMNKQIEQDAFNNALNLFKQNKTSLYNTLSKLP